MHNKLSLNMAERLCLCFTEGFILSIHVHVASGQELPLTGIAYRLNFYRLLILPLNSRPPSQTTLTHWNLFSILSVHSLFILFIFKLSSLHLGHVILQVHQNENVSVNRA